MYHPCTYMCSKCVNVCVCLCLCAFHAAYSKCNEVQQIQQQNKEKNNFQKLLLPCGSAGLKDT